MLVAASIPASQRLLVVLLGILQPLSLRAGGNPTQPMTIADGETLKREMGSLLRVQVLVSQHKHISTALAHRCQRLRLLLLTCCVSCFVSTDAANGELLRPDCGGHQGGLDI